MHISGGQKTKTLYISTVHSGSLLHVSDICFTVQFISVSWWWSAATEKARRGSGTEPKLMITERRLETDRLSCSHTRVTHQNCKLLRGTDLETLSTPAWFCPDMCDSMFHLFIPPCSSSTRPIPSSEPKKNNHWLPLLDHSDSPHVPLCYLPVSQEFICIPQDHKSHFYLTGLNNYDRNMSPSFLRTSILIRLLLCFIAATWCNPPHSCWAPSQLCAE